MGRGRVAHGYIKTRKELNFAWVDKVRRGKEIPIPHKKTVKGPPKQGRGVAPKNSWNSGGGLD